MCIIPHTVYSTVGTDQLTNVPTKSQEISSFLSHSDAYPTNSIMETLPESSAGLSK